MASSEEQNLEEKIQRQDLRQKLFQDLTSRFTFTLDADGSLPVEAQTALVGLLKSEIITPDEIIESVSANEPESEDGTDE